MHARPSSAGTRRLLLVEDDPSLREALEVTLAIEEIPFTSCSSAEAALRAIASQEWAVLVSDIRLPGTSGIDLLFESRKLRPELPVVLMTAYADASTAVDALRGGARDFLLKPFRPNQFTEVVKRYLAADELGAVGPDGPVAVDPVTRQLLTRLDRVAQTDATVLLLGESGSGKEVMAQYLHARSQRGRQPFVAINCAAIPSTLLEATLFGHEKGAYTGAVKSQPGKFELAKGGSIFLDEIGEMPLDLQTKLLRVLQERRVERVGSHQTITLDLRVITATNQDLLRRVSEGRFREDLFYRINVFPLRVAPLRERPADIVPLAERFLLKYRASMGQPEAKLADAARKALLDHPWPGNVRELENAIQRGLLLCTGPWIQPDDLSLVELPSHRLPAGARDAGAEALPGGVIPVAGSNLPADVQGIPMGGPGTAKLPGGEVGRAGGIASDHAPEPPAEGWAHTLPDGSGAFSRANEGGVPSSIPGRTAGIRQVEQDHILQVLRHVGGNRKRAVQILGISERTLRYKLKLWRESGIPIP